MRKEIIDSPWDFTLYDENGMKIFEVVYCNSFVDFSRNFKLEGEEFNYSFEQLKVLAQDIRANYENYKERELLDQVYADKSTKNPNLNQYQIANNTGEDTIIAIDIVTSVVVLVKGVGSLAAKLPKKFFGNTFHFC